MKFDAALARFASGGPTEASFFQTLGRDPGPSPIEVEQLDSIAALIGKNEERIAGGRELEMIGSDLLESIEGFAHVAGIESEINLEGRIGKI